MLNRLLFSFASDSAICFGTFDEQAFAMEGASKTQILMASVMTLTSVLVNLMSVVFVTVQGQFSIVVVQILLHLIVIAMELSR